MARQMQLLKSAEVVERVGIGHQTLRRWVRAGKFPAPIQIGPRRIAWLIEDIEEWLDSRPRVA